MYGQAVSLGISPEYFLDNMSQTELGSLFRADMERVKLRWEQTRLISFYTMISQHGTKKIKRPSDLFKFPWDKKTKTVTQSTSPEELKKIMEEVKQHMDGK